MLKIFRIIIGIVFILIGILETLFIMYHPSMNILSMTVIFFACLLLIYIGLKKIFIKKK
jgi:hypothetical protein